MRKLILSLLVLITFKSFAQVEQKFTFPDSVTILQDNAPFRKAPDNYGELISRIPSGTKAALLEVIGEYLKIRIGTVEGYMSYSFILSDSENLKKYVSDIRLANKKRAEAEKDSLLKEEFRIEQLQKNEDFQVKLAEMTKKYGNEIGKKIAFGNVWIGMTEKMLLDSRGYPENINRTVTKYGENKQYVYLGNKYVYVENGKVTSWQD